MVVEVTRAEQDRIDLIWQSWDNITRFHRSMRIAMAREQDHWAPVRSHREVKVSAPVTMLGGPADVTLGEYRAALGSTGVLNGLLLLQSWSLAEALALVSLKKPDGRLGKVEEWAPVILSPNGKSVDDLPGGLAAVVESFIARNSIAHVQPEWTVKMCDRIEAAGGDAPALGERVDLSDPVADRHRHAVHDLMRLTGLTETSYP